MINLSTYAGVKSILEQHGLKARKSLGQNFLTDPHVRQKIIRAANLTRSDCVLEIGPGIGGLTQALAAEAGHVLAVEIDKGLAAVLQDIFMTNTEIAHSSNVEIVHSDILDYDIAGHLSRFAEQGMRHKVVANLPYYVTTPIVMHLLENFSCNEKGGIDSITVMVQREVAERMVSSPGNAAYGALSLAVQYHADVSIAAYVPPNCFFPRPKVGSAVVHMDILPQPRVNAPRKELFAIIRAGFGQRRKTLVNALFSAELYPLSKAQIGDIISECGFAKNAAHLRGEELTLVEWARLLEALEREGMPL